MNAGKPGQRTRALLASVLHASVRDAFLLLFLNGFPHQILDGVAYAVWVLRSYHSFHEVFEQAALNAIDRQAHHDPVPQLGLHGLFTSLLVGWARLPSRSA